MVTTFAAMGTSVVIHGNDKRSVRASKAMFERSEQLFSRFRPTSELSGINRTGESGVEVSEDMRQVLEAAADLRSRTDGLVDIGVGSAVRDWGYDTTYRDVADLDEAPEIRSVTGWCLNETTVRLSRGTYLDLGGIAKGWTCDRVVESGNASIASAGGDVRSKDPALVVEIMDHENALAAEVHVGIGALATSSRSKRRWKVGGRHVHHIIDPRTARPAVTPVLSASVVSDTAAEAEAGAKAVLIRGADGLRWADSQPWIRQAIVVWHDGSVYGNAPKRAS